jgi:long-chain acyl-CoA synthetase
MYLEYYGLKEPPFALTPDPRFIYFTPSHREVMANLHYGIEHGKGLIVVTGEVGTGKTTMLRWMLQRLDRTVLVAYLFNPRLTVPEFYQQMTKLLDIQNWEAKSDLLMTLGRILETRHIKGLRTVLIIDEAQGLSPYVLEEIRLLMNFESDTAKYLQVVLSGQPELKDVLNKQEFRQLKQRIALRCEIEPLKSVSETENYILTRLQIAECEQPAIFSPEAIACIYKITGGIPRLINNICDNALLAGFAAEMPIIGRRVIEDVAETFDILPQGYNRQQPMEIVPSDEYFFPREYLLERASEAQQSDIEAIYSIESQKIALHKPVAEPIELRKENEYTEVGRVIREGTTGAPLTIGKAEENLITFPTAHYSNKQKPQIVPPPKHQIEKPVPTPQIEEPEPTPQIEESKPTPQIEEPKPQVYEIAEPQQQTEVLEEPEQPLEVVEEEEPQIEVEEIVETEIKTVEPPEIDSYPEVAQMKKDEELKAVPQTQEEELEKTVGGSFSFSSSRIGLGLRQLGIKIGLIKAKNKEASGQEEEDDDDMAAAIQQLAKPRNYVVEVPTIEMESIPEGKPKTIPQMAIAAMQQYKKQDALNHKQNGKWEHISGETVLRRVRHIALGLSKLGVVAGDRIAIISENRPEWSITDLAILSLGAVNIPIYTTQPVEDINYILKESEAKILFLSSKKTFKHALPGIEDVDPLDLLVFFDTDAKPEDIEQSLTLEELEKSGEKFDRENPQEYEKLLSEISPEYLATIIYTSGTTGEPKGVMLTHKNFVSNVYSISTSLPIFHTDVSLSVLPLSHIFERTVFYVFCWNGVSVHYSPSFDQLAEHLQEVRPTIMTAVPRLFEKVYHKIVRKGLSNKGWKKKVFMWAMEIGPRYAELKSKKKSISPFLELKQSIASKLVFSKWREGVGGRLRYFVSGGAPLAPALSYAFIAADIPILQGFGMTETCIVSANRTDDNKVGSIGRPFPGIKVRIEGDGEILVKGPNVMQGYYNKPETTQSVFNEDGWFMTGDVGRVDDDGHLYITDRKKDLFKLSNGKYVAPQQIESLLKESEFINQVVVVGSGHKTVGALIVPDWDALKRALREIGVEPPSTRKGFSQDPNAIKMIQMDCTNLTKSLSDYERVKRIALLPEELTIDGGELTPTLKVKRAVVDEKYKKVISQLYGLDS